MIDAVIIVGELFYTLSHHHPLAGILLAASVVALRRGWFLRLVMTVFLICLIHDAITGQLP